MGYKLEADEPLHLGLKRIARERLDDALVHLRGEVGDDREDRVHEARKDCKKVRGLLRLIRDEIGEDVYKRENVALRDTARLLSDVRDAQMLSETIDKLREQAGDSVPGELVARVAGLLAERERETVERVLDDQEAMAEAEQRIVAARDRVDAWPIDHVGAEMFEDGLKRTYKRGLKTFRAAYDKPSTERFHEWRKRAKYLWYEARILEPAAEGAIGAVVDCADELGDVLGLDHDLAVLWDAVADSEPLAADREGAEALRQFIDRRRMVLQRRALPLGRRLWAEKPSSFARRTVAHVDAWHLEQESGRSVWVTPEDADRARALLVAKPEADAAAQRQIRAELRDRGLPLAELDQHVPHRPDGIGAADLDALIARGVVRVGDARDFAMDPDGVDPVRRADVADDPGPGRGLCAIDEDGVLQALGWQLGFWMLTDGPAERSVAAIGQAHGADGADGEWQAVPVPLSVPEAARKTARQAVDCFVQGGWVYVVGSQQGPADGPMEPAHQFVGRFRETDAAAAIAGGTAGEAGAADSGKGKAAGEAAMELSSLDFALHRAINDALSTGVVDVDEPSGPLRAAFIGDAIASAQRDGADWLDRVRVDDLPSRVGGATAAGRRVLIGLQSPTSRSGHPVIVELAGLASLFGRTRRTPAVRALWELNGVGNRQVPAGIHGLSVDEDGSVEVLTGPPASDLDGALAEHQPESTEARPAHLRLRLPKRPTTKKLGGGRVEVELVREFPGVSTVEGLARDPAGRSHTVGGSKKRSGLRVAERRPG